MQAALSTRNAYRPGSEVGLDAGAHYAVSPKLTGLIQMNAQFKERDSGANANVHSGEKSLNLSPA